MKADQGMKPAGTVAVAVAAAAADMSSQTASRTPAHIRDTDGPGPWVERAVVRGHSRIDRQGKQGKSDNVEDVERRGAQEHGHSVTNKAIKPLKLSGLQLLQPPYKSSHALAAKRTDAVIEDIEAAQQRKREHHESKLHREQERELQILLQQQQEQQEKVREKLDERRAEAVENAATEDKPADSAVPTTNDPNQVERARTAEPRIPFLMSIRCVQQTVTTRFVDLNRLVDCRYSNETDMTAMIGTVLESIARKVEHPEASENQACEGSECVVPAEPEVVDDDYLYRRTRVLSANNAQFIARVLQKKPEVVCVPDPVVDQLAEEQDEMLNELKAWRLQALGEAALASSIPQS
jgi:hypothetical protein